MIFGVGFVVFLGWGLGMDGWCMALRKNEGSEIETESLLPSKGRIEVNEWRKAIILGPVPSELDV
jgi:hypothetical protein